MAVPYACFGELCTQPRFVSGNRELQNVVRGGCDAAFRDEEIMGEEEGEDWSQLRRYQSLVL